FAEDDHYCHRKILKFTSAYAVTSTCWSTAVLGSVMRKQLPASFVGSRVSRPPLTSTAHLAIASPSPVPPFSRERASSTRSKRSNTRDRSSGGVPDPVSVPT